MRLRIVLVSIVLFAGCSSGAPSSATTGATVAASTPAAIAASEPAGTEVALLADGSAEHTLGETILLSGGEFAGDQANLTVEQALRLGRNDATGRPLYAFLVEIEGRDPENLPYNMLDFSLFDDEGFEYQAESGERQPELTYGDLATGRRVKGWLTFAGPDDAQWLELEYAPVLALEAARVRALLP